MEDWERYLRSQEPPGPDDENSQTWVRDTIANCPPQAFKAAFIEWWSESEHGGWEGFGDETVSAFEDMMHDFAMFIVGAPAGQASGFIGFGSQQVDLSTAMP